MLALNDPRSAGRIDSEHVDFRDHASTTLRDTYDLEAEQVQRVFLDETLNTHLAGKRETLYVPRLGIYLDLGTVHGFFVIRLVSIGSLSRAFSAAQPN
jgi:hypothetical protein